MLMVSSTAPASTLSAHSLRMEDLSLTALAPRTVSTSRPGTLSVEMSSSSTL